MQLISRTSTWVALTLSLVTSIHDVALANRLESTRKQNSADIVASGLDDRLDSLQAQFPPLPLFSNDREDVEDVQDCLEEDERDNREECLEDLRDDDRNDDREAFEEDRQNCLDEDNRDDRRDCLEDLQGDHRDHWNGSRPDIAPMNPPRSMPRHERPMW